MQGWKQSIAEANAGAGRKAQSGTVLANLNRIDDNENAKHASAIVNWNNDPQGDNDKGDWTHKHHQFPTEDAVGSKYRYYFIEEYWDWGYNYKIVYITINNISTPPS